MVEFGTPRIILPSNAGTAAEAVAVDINSKGKKRSFVIFLGDLTEVRADAIVCPTNPGFELGFGGVLPKVIERRAGIEVFNEAAAKAQALIPTEGVDYGGRRGLPTGYAIATSAGLLSERYRHIIHVNSMPSGEGTTMDDVDVVKQSIMGSLQAADALRLRSIAFPALGTGLFNMRIQDTLLATVAGVRTFYREAQPETQLDRVLLAIYYKPSTDNAQATKELLEKQLS